MDWDKLEQDAYSYLNLSPHDLYEFTHREYMNMMTGYNEKEMRVYEQQLKLQQFNAWHVAAYVGMSFNGDKLPDLNEILTKPLFEAKDIPKQDNIELTEEQKFTQARNKWLNIKKAGIIIPPEILNQYNIK